MKQSQLFTKTRKEAPKNEVSKNAQLLIRGGFIHKEIAGVYDYLPLGLRVRNKIANIIREEMDLIGGQEIDMASLQGKELWEKAGKWDDDKVDVWFKTQLKNGGDLGLAFSHEEAIAEMLRNHVTSYKDLPLFVYQIQTKFRNELRAKSGIMRGREFLMKDMYSFTRTSEELHEFYERAARAYMNVFDRVGLGDITYRTAADGSVFGDRSDEFQTVSDAGEDTIYLDEEKRLAVNEEVYTDQKIQEMGLAKDALVEKRAIEVGNIFPIESIIADKIGFNFTDEDGTQKPIIMGSYGIGVGRVMGTIVESLSDEAGIVWPEEIAPFRIHLVVLGKDEVVKEYAEGIYNELVEKGVDVLYDDRTVGAGEKFADSDLIGIPTRIVVSEKTMAAGELEVKERSQGEAHMVSEREYIDKITA